MHFNSVHHKLFIVILAALFLGAAGSVAAQIAPAAYQTTSHISVGGGFSYFDVDWDHSRMYGGTLWVDVPPPHLPTILSGLRIEAEGRDIQWHTGDKPPKFREATAGGGLIYEWHHFHSFQPYVKGEVFFGGINFGQQIAPDYSHDTRTVYAPGVGIEYKIFRHTWARVEYEYQFWPDLTYNTYLNPQGFTGGIMYDLRPFHRGRY